MLNIKYFVAVLVISSTIFAPQALSDEQSPLIDCEPLSQFYAYKDGMNSHHNKDFGKAFNIFCNLALQGDDRAQFRLAEYYSGKYASNTPIDLQLAYIWSRLANTRIYTVKRTELYQQIRAQLAGENLELSQLAFGSFMSSFNTGNRVDKQRKKLDLKRIYKEYHDKINNRIYTGSRIRGRVPTDSLSIQNDN
jgi:TPR repeat protein